MRRPTPPLAGQLTSHFLSNLSDGHGSMIAANNQPAPADREHGKFISRSGNERNQISLAEVISQWRESQIQALVLYFMATKCCRHSSINPFSKLASICPSLIIPTNA